MILNLLRIFLVRHAEQVPTSSILSPLGQLQVTALADTFKSMLTPTSPPPTTFDSIFTSSLCISTAQALGSILLLPVHILNESTTTTQELVSQFEHTDAATSIILVTHAHVMDEFYRIVLQQDPPLDVKKPMGCVSVFSYNSNEGEWNLEQWASVEHLPKSMGNSPSGGKLYAFSNQVSGSFPMLRGDGGELCKPATANELACYKALFAIPAISREVEQVSRCVPQYFGTVEINVRDFVTASVAQEVEEEEQVKPPPPPPPPPRRRSSFLAALHHTSLTSTPSSFVQQQPQQHSNTMTSTTTTTTSTTSTTNPEGIVSSLWKRFMGRMKKTVQTQDGNVLFLVLEDVTFGLVRPNIMDLKLGTRQYRDTETDAKKNRKAERCKDSTSATLGFRIHGIAQHDSLGVLRTLQDKYSGRELNETQATLALKNFVLDCSHTPVRTPATLIQTVITQLEVILSAVENSSWRFWGSSILFVYDAFPTSSNSRGASAVVKLIDFGSCDMNVEGKVLGSGHDTGFALGLTNLIAIFKEALLQAEEEAM